MVRNLTQQQIESIQIDEGLLFVNYGEDDERTLAPTRGGGELTITNNVRNIEHDGQSGEEAGLQVVDSQTATLKITVLDTGQKNIALAIPGCVTEADGSITNGDNGIIPEERYLKNVTMFSRMLSGKYKKTQIFRAMHKGALSMKATPKAEGELALEFSANFNPKNQTEKIWRISEVDDPNSTLTVESAAGATTGKTKITVTGATAGNTLKYKTAATVTIPQLGENIGADGTFLAFTSGNEYTATTGHDFVVVELSTAGAVLKTGKITVVSK